MFHHDRKLSYRVRVETGTEEIAHIEMLASAVALNVEGAPAETKSTLALHPILGAVMGGMDSRHILSAGIGAMAADSNGVPFSFSFQPAAPLGDEPVLAPPVPAGHTQQEQMTGARTADPGRPLARCG